METPNRAARIAITIGLIIWLVILFYPVWGSFLVGPVYPPEP